MCVCTCVWWKPHLKHDAIALAHDLLGKVRSSCVHLTHVADPSWKISKIWWPNRIPTYFEKSCQYWTLRCLFLRTGSEGFRAVHKWQQSFAVQWHFNAKASLWNFQSPRSSTNAARPPEEKHPWQQLRMMHLYQDRVNREWDWNTAVLFYV